MSSQLLRARKTLRSALAAVLTGLIAATGIVALSSPAAAAPGDGPVHVTVIRDFDGNGAQGEFETTGVAGLTVSLEDAAGNAVTATTDAAGKVSLDPSGLAGDRYRVRTEIPEPLSDFLRPAPAGGVVAGERTFDALVTYVTAQDGVPTEVLQGVWNPYDHLGESPDALVAFSSNQAVGTSVISKDLAPASTEYKVSTGTDTGGALYGVAYDRAADRAFLGAYDKRHTPFGPGGNGAIYVRDDLSSATAFAPPAGSTQLWTVVPNTGTTPHGADLDHDDEIFNAVGKEGLGDIQLSENGSLLYAVNLHDRSLYAYATADATLVSVTPIPVPSAMDGREGDWRPFGLGVRDGVLYVGGVDSAESVVGDLDARRASLRAYVWEFADGSFGTSPVVDHSLDFPRGQVWNGFVGIDQNDFRYSRWNPWQGDFGSIDDWAVPHARGTLSQWVVHPQPILSDIAVAADGSLVLGFRDRTGDQFGRNAPAPGSSAPLFEVMSGGDTNRVCLVGDDFVWEGEAGCPNHNFGNEINGGQGEFDPNGNRIVEYYPGDSAAGVHYENSLGSVAILPAQGQLLRTYYATGISQFGLMDDSTGARLFGVGPSVNYSSFGKGGGISAIGLIASAPIPVQVGNRTWYDANRDGIQDPDEPPLADVTVTLVKQVDGGADEVVATTTTDARGLYYFGVEDGLNGDDTFTVRFDYSTADLSGEHFTGYTLDDLEWTTPNAGADDQIQSRAIPDTFGGTATVRDIRLTPDQPVDHRVDAGVRLSPRGSFMLTKQLGAGDIAPEGASFTIEWTADGVEQDDIVLAAGAAFTSGTFQTGTRITLTEVAPTVPLPAGDSWATPVFTVNGEARPAGSTVSFDITEDRTTPAISVTLTNDLVDNGTFTVTKTVTPEVLTALGQNTTFPVEWRIKGTAGSGGTVNLTPATPGTFPYLPAGTVVQVREPLGSRPALPASLEWQSPVYTNGAGTVIPADAEGWIEFTVGGDAAVGITVSNPAAGTRGTFSIEKTLSGVSAGQLTAGTTFTFDIAVNGVAAGQGTVSAASNWRFQSDPYPYGTTITISEVTPADTVLPSTLRWAGIPTLRSGAVTETDNSIDIVIGANNNVQVEATNTAVGRVGSFTLTKQVTGTAVAGTQFVVDYWIAGVAQPQPITLTAGQTFTGPTLPIGTKVEFAERTPSGGLSGDDQWGAPAWAGTTTNSAGRAELTIVETTAQTPATAVTVTNPVVERNGFTVTKALTGQAADAGTGAQYSFEYLLPGQSEPTTLSTMFGAVASAGPFELGTTIRLREVPPTAGALSWPGASWAGVAYTVNGNSAEPDEDGYISFAIGGDQAISIVVTNDTTLARGTFALTKSLEAGFEQLLGDATFTVTYLAMHPSFAGGSIAGSLTVVPGVRTVSAQFPVGTIVQLTEVTPADLPGLIQWDGGTFTIGGVRTQELTIAGAGADTVEVELVNNFTQLIDQFGRFSIEKQTTGIALSELMEGAAFEFSWNATTPDGTVSSGTGTVSAATDWRWTGPSLPTGTTVTISEYEPAGSVLPDGYVWSGLTLTDGVNTSSSNSLEITIGEGNAVVRVVANNAAHGLGGFSLSKALDGNASGQVPAATEYSVTITIGGGEPFTRTLTAGAEPLQFGPYPTGTQVTITETVPADTASLDWVTPSFALDGTTQSPASNTVTFAIGAAGSVTAVGLTNTVNQIVAGFSITKQVAEGTPVNANTPYQVQIKIGNAEWGQPETIIAGQSLTRTGIQVGTTVFVREVAPAAALPTGFTWAAPVLTGPAGASVDGDGVLSFVLGSGAADTQVVTITNSTIEHFGSFTLQKVLTAAEGAVVAGTVYPVNVWVGNAGDPQVIELTAGAPAVTVGPFRLGTVVRVEEQTPPANALVDENDQWAAPVIRGTNLMPADAGGWQFTIENEVTPLAITVENVVQDRGTFLVSKSVTGPAEGAVPADQPFEIVYKVGADGEEQTLTVFESNDPQRSGTATSAEIPDGATVYLKETPSGVDLSQNWSGAGWLAPVYRINGQPATPAEDGWINFVLDGDTAVTVEVENPTQLQEGSFTVLKALDGGAANLPDGATYQVGYTATHPSFAAPRTGTITVTPGQPTAPVLLPVGTEVTLVEATPVGLPAGVVWVGARWTNADGEVTDQLTIPAGPDGAVANVELTVTNTLERPEVDIEKGDDGGLGGAIVNDGDTMREGQYYGVGEERTIVFTLTNTGTEPLRNVVVTDTALLGGTVEQFQCTFPDGIQVDGSQSAGVGQARWEASFAELDPATWAVGGTFDCTAQLVASEAALNLAHTDSATVDGVGAVSGVPVRDVDNYNEFTAGIQVIKYDGTQPDPEADGVVPGKPLLDPAQDANDAEHAVLFRAGIQQPVRWVVTNTSPTTFLTDIALRDVTGSGPSIEAWWCDLRPLGGPARYSFTADGNYAGLWAPGVSFFCEGVLTLPAGAVHDDIVYVDAAVVVPSESGESYAVDETTGRPLIATVNGIEVRLSDSDPFHAKTPELPTLPFTGSEVTAVVLPIGIVLLVIGVVLTIGLWTLRRRHSA